MDQSPRISEKQMIFVALFAAILLGVWLRVTPALSAGFPINDGGMFYSMMKDLQSNGFALPAFTSYNASQYIPFAYPPFALYVGALLANFFPITQILLWLPAIVSIGVCLAFYALSRKMLTPLQAAFATLFFALIPINFSWFLMGGGLTRSFGQLFLILTALFTHLLFTERKRRYLFLTIAAGALAVLSHPEAGLHAFGLALILWFFKGRSRSTFFDGALVAVGVFALTELWWGPVIARHGLAPLINATRTGNYSILAWGPLFTFSFTEEPLLRLIAMLGLIGLFVCGIRRNFLFLAWLVLPFVFEPRSASWIIGMPLVMTAAICVTDLLLPVFAALEQAASFRYMKGQTLLFFLGFLILYSLVGSYAIALKMGADHLDVNNQQAMDWIAQNVPGRGSFVVLTGAADTMHDSVQEWFPALTDDDSETTLQGREWTWGARFIPAIAQYQSLQSCMSGHLACVETQAKKLKLSFRYLYIQKQTRMQCADGEACQYNGKDLLDDLTHSSDYVLVYENAGAVIFSKVNP